MKRIILVSLALLLAVLSAAGVFLARGFQPATGPERVEVAADVVGVKAGRTYAYLVSAPQGLVLVDTGSDPAAAALLAELGRRGLGPDAVGDILLTSVHPDHAAAVHLFPRATSWIGRDDLGLALRERLPRAPIARIASRLVQRNARLERVRLALPGARLAIAGATFDVVSLPGVTPGSSAFVRDGVAFTGSSLGLDGARLVFPSWLVADAPRNSRAASPRLAAWSFSAIADGRHGVHQGGRAALDAALKELQSDAPR